MNEPLNKQGNSGNGEGIGKGFGFLDRVYAFFRISLAFSFILGVLPLVVASGAGAEARVVMGVALLGGMALATMLGVFFYPMLFVFIGKIAGYEKKRDLQKEQG